MNRNFEVKCELKTTDYKASQTQHTRTNQTKKKIENIIKKILINLRNIILLYKDADISYNRTIIARLFPNKLLFDCKKHRTGRMSEASEFIYMTNK